jgi:hypothetical protein
MILGTLIFTAVAAGAARDAASEAGKMVSIAVGAKIQTRKMFVAEQRPWISIEVLDIASPLSFDKKGVVLRFKIRIENTGRSPAENVRQHWDVLPNADKARAELQRISIEHREKIWREDEPPGQLLFPGRKPERTRKFRIWRREFSKINEEFEPVLIGCITYETKIANERLQTVYFGPIQKNIKSDKRRSFTLLDVGEIPQSQMRITGDFVQDSSTAGIAPAEDDETE